MLVRDFDVDGGPYQFCEDLDNQLRVRVEHTVFVEDPRVDVGGAGLFADVGDLLHVPFAVRGIEKRHIYCLGL